MFFIIIVEELGRRILEEVDRLELTAIQGLWPSLHTQQLIQHILHDLTPQTWRYFLHCSLFICASLFDFPVNKGSSLTSATITSFSLSFLTRNHLRLAYIKSIEILFIEEIGLLPGHLMNAIDYILRKFSDKPF